MCVEIGSKANTKWCRGSKRKKVMKALTVCIVIGILLLLIGFFMPTDEVTAADVILYLDEDGNVRESRISEPYERTKYEDGLIKEPYLSRGESVFYTITPPEDGAGLYVQNSQNQSKKLFDGMLTNFVLSSDGKELFGIRLFPEFNGITIEMHYKLIRLNIETGEYSELCDVDTDCNFVLKNIDDKYLIYVEERIYRDSSKVYCFDLQTGERKHIYTTKQRVVDIKEGEKEDIDILSLYTMEDDGENYRLSIKNTKGEEIYFEENSSSLWPNVWVIYDDTILVKKGRGDAHLYTFINVSDSLVSEDFPDIEAWNREKVTYVTFKDGKMKLIVQDIYDKEKYYVEIERDFDESKAVGHYLVTKATFLNDSQLFIEYYSNPEEGERWESKQEIIDLPY